MMKMKRLLLTLLSLLLLSTASLQAQDFREARTAEVKPAAIRDLVKAAAVKSGRRVTRAESEPHYGVKATMKYERLADMPTVHYNHQVFPSGNGFVVMGGIADWITPTRKAELYLNGKWTSLTPPDNASDPTFSVILSDGRVMVGGGGPRGYGLGPVKGTAIYTPASQTFTKGPDMTVARSYANGLLLNGNVYVAGNLSGDDTVYDRYNGQTFSAYGRTGGFMSPYIFTDANGSLYEVSPKTTKNDLVENRTFSSGNVLLPGYLYDVTDGKTYYFGFPFATDKLLDLPIEMKTSDYGLSYLNFYFMLARNSSNVYKLTLFYPDAGANEANFYKMTDDNFVIPTYSSANKTDIEWRGGVFVNEAKDELYLIGASGTGSSWSLHLISFSYYDYSWSIATVDGLGFNPLKAGWTLLKDGRLACTGGLDTNYLPTNSAYIFTPPVAGTAGEGNSQGSADGEQVLVVLTKDNKLHEFIMAGSTPQVKFEGSSLRVMMATGSEAEFALSDIIRFTYKKRSATGIDDLTIDDEPTTIDFSAGELVISQIKAGANIGVYGLDGKCVRQVHARHAGTYRISLSALPKGVYIVKADTITYKLMKR